MHSKDILIDSLTYFWSLVIFERDDFILDQCEGSKVPQNERSYSDPTLGRSKSYFFMSLQKTKFDYFCLSFPVHFEEVLDWYILGWLRRLHCYDDIIVALKNLWVKVHWRLQWNYELCRRCLQKHSTACISCIYEILIDIILEPSVEILYSDDNKWKCIFTLDGFFTVLYGILTSKQSLSRGKSG